jgi:hypothetical protein
MPLLRDFRAAAERRGLLNPGDELDAAGAFALVRDMPYRRASSREPAVTLAEWTGTCSGKHYLLKALLEALGYATMLMVCTHEFARGAQPWLPPELLALLEYGPVPDVHQFLRVQIDPAAPDGVWMTVDATWPLAAGELGLPANEHWEDGRDMRVAADPIELFHTPDGEDPQAFKELIIEREVGDEARRRDGFIEALSDWLTRSLEG